MTTPRPGPDPLARRTPPLATPRPSSLDARALLELRLACLQAVGLRRLLGDDDAAIRVATVAAAAEAVVLEFPGDDWLQEAFVEAARAAVDELLEDWGDEP